MIWFALGALALLLGYAFLRARSLGPLFADDHLAAIGKQLPDLKRAALAGRPEEPASIATETLVIAYGIRRAPDEVSHHLSVSSPVTAARGAGTFFLGLLRSALGLEGRPFDAFVSETNVFHLRVRLTPKEQAAFEAQDLAVLDAGALREKAIAGRAVLQPVLRERAASALPEKTGAPPA
jgi:hypothetical protein